MKRRDDEKDVLAEALAQLKKQGLSQQPPKAVVDETIRRLAEARPASDETDPRAAKRILFGRMNIAAPLAAAALIALGFAVGRLSGPKPMNLDELRQALAPSVAASIEPALRAALVDDMRQQYQVALAASYVKVKEELTQQYRDDLNRFAVQTLAASNAVTNRLLAELIENIDTTQAEDQTRIARALHQIELNRMQDKTQLAAGLQTLASRTEDELSRTRQAFVQLLANHQPEDLGLEPRPFQNPKERNKP
jgi:hypothetical protein